jgi:heme-degrading monooxygenase HmoA
MAERMEELAQQQDGFLGMETATGETGITISYWRDEACILKWKQNAEHLLARRKGREQWYTSFVTRVCKVERDYANNL